MNLRVIQEQNEQNHRNQRRFLGRELYEYYCLGLHKKVKWFKTFRSLFN
jgi:hypothetical protein